MAGLSQELQDKIDEIKNEQTRIQDDLQTVKDEVENELEDAAFKVMTDTDFTQNEDYKEYLGVGTVTVRPDSDNERKAWIKSLSPEQRLRIVCEYTTDYRGEGEKTNLKKGLIDKKGHREVTKASMEESAKKILRKFEELKVTHAKMITELKGKVTEKKAERKIIDDKIRANQQQIGKNLEALKSAKNAAPSQAQVEEVRKANENLNAEIDEFTEQLNDITKAINDLETKIKDAEDQRDILELAVSEAIEDSEKKFRNHEIYVGRFAKQGEKENTEGNTQNPEANSANVANSQGVSYTENPTREASNMMPAFRRTSNAKIMEMVEEMGYENVLSLAQNVSLVDRREFYRRMKNIIEDKGDVTGKMPDENNPNGFKNITIKKTDLINIVKMNGSDFKKMEDLMRYYTENYSSMTVHERKKADDVMAYIKIATLLGESRRSGFRKFIGRLTERGSRITSLEGALLDFSKAVEERRKSVEAEVQDIGAKLGIKVKKTPEVIRDFDRSGKNPIYKGRTIQTPGKKGAKVEEAPEL